MIKISIILFLIVVLTSCYSRRKIPNIHTPTKKEIRRAMKYSTYH